MMNVVVRRAVPGFTLGVAWDAGDAVVALFGPSGAGKSLTLQCLAGLERPDAGRIVVNGRIFDDVARGVHLVPQARRLGYVFQGYALFPHLTVAENVGFGLRGRAKAERSRRTAAVLDRPELAALAGRRRRELPHRPLSGRAGDAGDVRRPARARPARPEGPHRSRSRPPPEPPARGHRGRGRPRDGLDAALPPGRPRVPEPGRLRPRGRDP